MSVENRTKVSLITSSEISERFEAALRAFFPTADKLKLSLNILGSLIKEGHVVSMDEFRFSIVS